MTVAPLDGVVTVTLAQLCAVPLLVVVPLYVNVLSDALAITFGVHTYEDDVPVEPVRV